MPRKKNKIIKTPFIKLQLMKYFRFDRNFIFVCSECINKSDISALNDSYLVEVEIKTSKIDFLREFSGKSKNKTRKHIALNSGEKPHKNYIIPNYYYFCVTPELKDFVQEYLQEQGLNKYGILVCNNKRIYGQRSHIYSVKTAKKIHNNPPSKTVYTKVSKRVQSELISLKERLDG